MNIFDQKLKDMKSKKYYEVRESIVASCYRHPLAELSEHIVDPADGFVLTLLMYCETVKALTLLMILVKNP